MLPLSSPLNVFVLFMPSKLAQALTSPFLYLHYLLLVVGHVALLAAPSPPEPAGACPVDSHICLLLSSLSSIVSFPSFQWSVLYSVLSWTL